MLIDELRRQLSDIEPDEATYAGITASEVGLLLELLVGPDEEPWLAARAAHALSRIDSDEARDGLVGAIDDPRPEVRVAIAASAVVLPPERSDQVLASLLDDSEPGVRKFAIRSTSGRNSEVVRQRVAAIASADPNPALRQIAETKAATVAPPVNPD